MKKVPTYNVALLNKTFREIEKLLAEKLISHSSALILKRRVFNTLERRSSPSAVSFDFRKRGKNIAVVVPRSLKYETRRVIHPKHLREYKPSERDKLLIRRKIIKKKKKQPK